jgi:hypothetical protein
VRKHLDSSTVLEYWNAIQGRISLLDSALATPCVTDLLMWPTVKTPEQFPFSSPHHFSLTLKGIHSLFKQWSGRFNEVSEQVSFSIDRYLNFPHMNSKMLTYMLIQGHTVLWYWILKSLIPYMIDMSNCYVFYSTGKPLKILKDEISQSGLHNMICRQEVATDRC